MSVAKSIAGGAASKREAVAPRKVPRPVNRYFWTKRLWSLTLAIPLAILLTPVIAALWALVRMTSPGPGFYSQIRLGRHGREFSIYKLRTMKVDAERTTGPIWSQRGDCRVTGFGRILRQYHLDELPQIYNVLWGDMSLIGPRPERPEIADHLAEQIPGYYVRIAVKPGITGMAQLHLDADESVDSVCAKLGYDLAYIERASPWLDFKVLMGTLLKALPGLSRHCVRVARCSAFCVDAQARGAEVNAGMMSMRRGTPRHAGPAVPKSRVLP